MEKENLGTMANDTPLNGQITDSITQANTKVLGEAPAQALGSLYQSSAHTLGMTMQNAVSGQQNGCMSGLASATQGVSMLYAIDTAEEGVAAAKINASDLPQSLSGLKAALLMFAQLAKGKAVDVNPPTPHPARPIV